MLFASSRGSKPGIRQKAEPDWTAIHHELRRPGVLLWEEYRAVHTTGYGYSHWCELYRSWEARLSPTMRQAHPAGERLFVDYAGQTVELVDGRTGELRAAVLRANWYEPGINPTYRDLAAHYGATILPTRVRRPRAWMIGGSSRSARSSDATCWRSSRTVTAAAPR